MAVVVSMEVAEEVVEGEAMVGDGAPMEVVEVVLLVAIAAVAAAMLVVAVEMSLVEALAMVPAIVLARMTLPTVANMAGEEVMLAAFAAAAVIEK